jgi:leucyl aminopeptidase (aminopeptidase T)
MIDARLKKLADNILSHSVALKKGERVMIRGPFAAKPLIMALVARVSEKGALPFVRILDEEITRCLLQGAADGRLGRGRAPAVPVAPGARLGFRGFGFLGLVDRLEGLPSCHVGRLR